MKFATTKKLTAAALASALMGSAAFAGGFERSSQDFTILFEEGSAAKAEVTIVFPNRELRNISSPAAAATRGFVPASLSTGTPVPYATSVEETENYIVPSVSYKMDLTEDFACAAQYRQPWGAKTDVGLTTVAALDTIAQEISSHDYGLNCGYRFGLEKGAFRLLGGVSYQEIEGSQTRLLLPNSTAFMNPSLRIGDLNADDSTITWRAGIAYEIPEIALRASLVYQSESDYTLEGQVANLAAFGPVPIFADATLPQSLDLRVQSGIAPGWLAFGSVKWVDWSVTPRVSFRNAVPLPTPLGLAPVGSQEITSLNLYYKDGWTVTGGIGHQLTEDLSVAGSITWDRGVTQGLSAQTDTWTFGFGAAYKPNENLEVRFGGAAGVLTSGSKDNRVVAGVPNPSGFYADFGNDFVGALNISAKLKF